MEVKTGPTNDYKNLRTLKNQELHLQLKGLVTKERKVTRTILDHLIEVSRRGLFLEMAFNSMCDYAVRGLGYSESAALRRLKAAKLVKDIPDLGKKLEDGEITLSQLEKAQRAFQEAERKRVELSRTEAAKPHTLASSDSPDSIAASELSTKLDLHQAPQILGASLQLPPIKSKAEIIAAIQGKSARETDAILARELQIQPVKFEKLKLQADLSGKLEITLDQKQLELLEHVKRELGFAVPAGSWAEVITYLATFWKNKASKQSAAVQIKDTAEPTQKRNPPAQGADAVNTPAQSTKTVGVTTDAAVINPQIFISRGFGF